MKKAELGWSLKYLLGTMLQMLLAVILKTIFMSLHIENGITAILLLAIGGTSSAVWGCMIAVKSHKVESVKQIFFDFFHLKVNWKYYLISILFLIITFGKQMIGLELNTGIVWYSFLILFIKSLLFGGIEEIGWRYTFQPSIETRIPYEISSVCTFICWGLWHYMFFYITDSLSMISHASFLLGLIVICFVTGAIYNLTKSLWLCVLYHVLANTFSQAFIAGSMQQTIITSIICIGLSVILVRLKMPIVKEESVCQ
ncbi:MAG TPA: CPBP family intramembrane glutamic endopeptidase [Lachnospiraceae bacterium]|nr:CPBP family intramembrane glutamic endopeptidase [Lachnospiraceae bacterium]